MEFNIVENDIIRWHVDDDPNNQILERVLWIDEDRKIAFVIDIFDAKVWPIRKTVNEITTAIQAGLASFATNDPFAFLQDDN